MPSPHDIKTYALKRAREMGFCSAGVAKAGRSPHAAAFADWLAHGCHADMHYLTRYLEQRRDTRKLTEWTRSILCLAARYAGAELPDGPVARYARTSDYHLVLKDHCRQLADEIRAMAGGGIRTRCCVDTAPLAERDWAWSAGLGFVGRNTCLIVPGAGSYVVLAEVLLELDLPADEPCGGDCGNCRRCIDACPTHALDGNGTMDARRCINWATIEYRGELSGDQLDLAGQIYGCDICQQVCPQNTGPLACAAMSELAHQTPLAGLDVLTVLRWRPEDWDEATRQSPARRASWCMFVRNACIVAGQQHLMAATEDLCRLSGHEDSIVAAAARWAMNKIGSTPL